MASEYVLEYGDYDYDGNYEFNSTNLDWRNYSRTYKNHNPNARSDFIEEKIENILAKIVICNYILREHDTGTDRKTACGIEHSDLKAAMEYVQAGFQNG